jgi:hypothetical protein
MNNHGGIKQLTINSQYTIKHRLYKKKLKGKICMKAKGLSELSVLRLDGSPNSQAGRLDLTRGSQRLSKIKLSSRGAIRLKSTQIRWFLRWPGRSLDCVNSGQRPLKGRVGKQL